ncbi:hypothetical protein L9F63_009349, partial [Diploptera punctata]
GLVFFGCASTVFVFFSQLARAWPAIAMKWEKVETHLAHYGYPCHQHRNFCIITTIVLFFAL